MIKFYIEMFSFLNFILNFIFTSSFSYHHWFWITLFTPT